MSKTDGGPAFPLPSTMTPTCARGMPLRDYFAGQALIGLLSGPWRVNTEKEGFLGFGMKAPAPGESSELLAKIAYKLADAMIEAKEGSS